jgi:hypothetical protein
MNGGEKRTSSATLGGSGVVYLHCAKHGMMQRMPSFRLNSDGTMGAGCPMCEEEAALAAKERRVELLDQSVVLLKLVNQSLHRALGWMLSLADDPCPYDAATTRTMARQVLNDTVAGAERFEGEMLAPWKQRLEKADATELRLKAEITRLTDYDPTTHTSIIDPSTTLFAIHELKIWPEFFEAIISGKKHYEIRKNDRNFKAGDSLKLREWDPIAGYSGRVVYRSVTHMSLLRDGHLAVMSLGVDGVNGKHDDATDATALALQGLQETPKPQEGFLTQSVPAGLLFAMCSIVFALGMLTAYPNGKPITGPAAWTFVGCGVLAFGLAIATITRKKQ